MAFRVIRRPNISSDRLITCTNQIRGFVYLRPTVQRVRGLKKDESEYLTANGILYPGNEDTLDPVKKFLGNQFELPDWLALQSITHKSFAHGKKPYNEKLAILGREFLKMHTTGYAISHNDESSSSGSLINNMDFDVMGRAMDILSSSLVTGQVCKKTGIADKIFWKKRSEVSFEVDRGCFVEIHDTNLQKLSEKATGASTVYSRTLYALVGAVLLRHGQEKAQLFVDEKLLSGDYSVLPISAEMYRE